MQYGLLIVEGQHDAAVIAKLLSGFKLKTIQNEKERLFRCLRGDHNR